LPVPLVAQQTRVLEVLVRWHGGGTPGASGTWRSGAVGLRWHQRREGPRRCARSSCCVTDARGGAKRARPARGALRTRSPPALTRWLMRRAQGRAAASRPARRACRQRRRPGGAETGLWRGAGTGLPRTRRRRWGRARPASGRPRRRARGPPATATSMRTPTLTAPRRRSPAGAAPAACGVPRACVPRRAGPGLAGPSASAHACPISAGRMCAQRRAAKSTSLDAGVCLRCPAAACECCGAASRASAYRASWHSSPGKFACLPQLSLPGLADCKAASLQGMPRLPCTQPMF